jgi:hypothetical protein
MRSLTSSSKRSEPVRSALGRCAAWLAVAGTLVLTGCATDRMSQRQDGAGPSLLPMLRNVGTGAPSGSDCRAHEPTAKELAKQRSAIDPLRVPELYTELFYKQHRDSTAAIDAGGMSFRRFRRFEHSGSGLSGFVLLDDKSGHALILFKGMDRPFSEGDSLGGAFTDLGGVLAAKFGTGNSQFPRAEEAYTEALCEEAIQSLEMVGYSMGSQIANYLAVKYGAYGVVFGDMGLDATLLKGNAHGDVKAARALAREHVVSLSLNGDVMVKMFGVGQVVGTVVTLPGGLAGVFHQPEVYANAANAAIRDREAERDKAAGAVTRAAAGAQKAAPSASDSR